MIKCKYMRIQLSILIYAVQLYSRKIVEFYSSISIIKKQKQNVYVYLCLCLCAYNVCVPSSRVKYYLA